MNVDTFNITFMELNNIHESAKVLSIAMLQNPLHIAALKGNGESQRVKIESMFIDLFNKLPGMTFIAKEDKKIVGVMRMKSCCGQKLEENRKEQKIENEIDNRIATWHREWALRDPAEQHWHLDPIGVLPSHRGLGIGSRLMKLFCKEVDKCSANAFLETDLDENVLFYKKFGFEVVSKSNIFDVECRYMARTVQKQTN